MITLENLSMITQIATLLGIVFVIYKTFREPDIKAAQEIAVMKAGCVEKHKALDSAFAIVEIKSKDESNHLHTIEEKMKVLSENQVKIFTILEERLPKKN